MATCVCLKEKCDCLSYDVVTWDVACVAWRFWSGALSNKGGRGQRNRKEIGAGATWFLFFSRLRRSFSRASRANFAATPLLRPARQNRHATQATWDVDRDVSTAYCQSSSDDEVD